MEANNLLVVIDAGHGGYDNGAAFEGRLEKDDNLRLALAVQKQLEAMGLGVLMTRTEDIFIPLPERADIANQAGADLFVSLHRNSYTEHTPSSHGVENIIYLTAPKAAEHMAQTVLAEVVQVGVQGDRGVTRGNYYVLRRTTMPAMLLEMGFIIDPEDNRLFDEKLEDYAAAIARGIGKALEVGNRVVIPVAHTQEEAALPVLLQVPDWPEVPTMLPAPRQTTNQKTEVGQPQEEPIAEPEATVAETLELLTELPTPEPKDRVTETVPIQPEQPAERPVQPPPPLKPTGSAVVRTAQQALNRRYGLRLEETGLLDDPTRRAGTQVLQESLNRMWGRSLATDGQWTEATRQALVPVGPESPEVLVALLQIWLLLRGYDTAGCSGQYTAETRRAVLLCQREEYLPPSGVADVALWERLLG